VEQEEIDAVGITADGIMEAIGIITASITTRCKITKEVKKDLEKALLVYIKKPGKPKPEESIAQLTLNKTIAQLLRMMDRENYLDSPPTDHPEQSEEET